jgi:hypothetical protein
MREKPRTPASRPKDARPRTGNAASREATRKDRLRAAEAAPAEGRGSASRNAGQRTRQEQPAKERVPKEKQPAKEQRRRAERPASERAAKQERSGPDAKAHSERKQTEREAARKQAAKEPARKQRATRPEEQPEAAPKAGKRAKAKKPHRVYNTNFGFKFVIMLSVVAVIVLSMIIFFKVKHIEVILPTDENGQPHSYYTKDEVAAASGISLDENLLSLSKATAAARIYAALPYVNEVQIKKQLPGTVVITFSEFNVTYGIQDERGGWWLMSRECRVLEAADEETIRGHMKVTGMPIQVPQVGEEIKPAATEGADMSEIANKLKVVQEIIPALEESDHVKQLDRVDVSTSYDLTLWWTGDRYEIKLGTTERLDYKLRFLQAAMENKEIQNTPGTIDLTFSDSEGVRFLPFSKKF